MTIDKSQWYTCKKCQKNIHELKKIHGGKNIYLTRVFKKHLQHDHNMSIDEYFNITEVCPCGICNKKLGVTVKGANFAIKKYACGRNVGVKIWSEQAKTSRLGSNNPMYGHIPWNKDLTAKNNEKVYNIACKLKGKHTPEETRKKQSEAAKKRTIHGHTGHKHSASTKQKMKESTLRMIQEGKFKHTQTKPHNYFKNLLDKLGIKYNEEHILSLWSFDFYLVEYDIYVEIDGDYFHSNPRIYPDGPKTKTQKINAYRDWKKNKYCTDNGIHLIRFWESDIFHMSKEQLLCKLREFYL